LRIDFGWSVPEGSLRLRMGRGGLGGSDRLVLLDEGIRDRGPPVPCCCGVMGRGDSSPGFLGIDLGMSSPWPSGEGG
jgi:hypothetical protein